MFSAQTPEGPLRGGPRQTKVAPLSQAQVRTRAASSAHCSDPHPPERDVQLSPGVPGCRKRGGAREVSREPAKNLGSLLGQSPEELLFLTNVGRGQVIMVLRDQTRIGQTCKDTASASVHTWKRRGSQNSWLLGSPGGGQSPGQEWGLERGPGGLSSHCPGAALI